MNIKVSNLSYSYNNKKSFAVKDVSTSFESGEFVAIVGHTGSGKSTFNQNLNALLVPTSGSVTVDEFTIENKQSAGTINGYEMYKFVGTHSFKYEDKVYNYKYVAYSTQQKKNGAYIYWLVQDESQDQTLYSTIEEYAYKMALSLREE